MRSARPSVAWGRSPIEDDAPVEAAGAVDAQNAPTAPWKTPGQFSTAPTGTLGLSHGDISIELTQGTFLTSFDIGGVSG